MSPKFLYKYYAFNEYSESIFKDNQIYFPSPLEFNDPFDCKIEYEIPGSDEVFSNELDSYWKENESSMSVLQKEKVKKEVLRVGIHRNPAFRKKLVKSTLNRISEFTGIYCLSEKYDDILMWSHYANGHKGYCLKFTTKGVLKHAKSVHYQKRYPKVTYPGPDDREWLNKILLTKSKRWSYECEWRLIDPRGGSGIRQFPNEELAGVILGCSMPKEDRNIILSFLDKRTDPVEIYEARIKEDKFGLNIIRINNQ